jgi:hypothetical protein
MILFMVVAGDGFGFDFSLGADWKAGTASTGLTGSDVEAAR